MSSGHLLIDHVELLCIFDGKMRVCGAAHWVLLNATTRCKEAGVKQWACSGGRGIENSRYDQASSVDVFLHPLVRKPLGRLLHTHDQTVIRLDVG
jgi:hypothetical protein